MTDYASANTVEMWLQSLTEKAVVHIIAIQTGKRKGTETGQSESSIRMATWKEVKEKDLDSFKLAHPGDV